MNNTMLFTLVETHSTNKLLFTLLVILFSNCDSGHEPMPVPYWNDVFGFTIDSITRQPIAGVIIAEQIGPDSQVFVGDSINSNEGYKTYEIQATSEKNGDFTFTQLHYYLTHYYRSSSLFAYKSGYRIWKFKASNDTIFDVGIDYHVTRDSLIIRMVKK